MFFIIKPVIEGLFENVEGKAFSVPESTYNHLRFVTRDREVRSIFVSESIQDRLLDILIEHDEFVGRPIKLVMYQFRRQNGRLLLWDRTTAYLK